MATTPATLTAQNADVVEVLRQIESIASRQGISVITIDKGVVIDIRMLYRLLSNMESKLDFLKTEFLELIKREVVDKPSI